MAYGSDLGLTAYLTATGRTLPGTTTAEIARFWGSLYVDQFEQCYRGTALQFDASFPRDLWTTVPLNVEHAAYEAGYAWASGVVIFGGGGTAGGQVTSEAVDTLKVTYAAPQDGWGYWESNMFILPAAYALLLPFMKHKGGFYPSALVV
ncbi:MAG: hypothetical protein IPL86_19295 [Flavobacteriales bacterium]|nr:hypothetical protein [Flavobacteriales bacterium]